MHAVYDELPEVLDRLGIPKVQGVLFDLGVSSMQLDEADRGFAYAQDAPLDMRMDQTTGIGAAEVLNTYPPGELVRILRAYGEEKQAKRIVSAVVREREKEPFSNSARLVELIRDSLPQAAKRTGGNPAKRTFQALRIEVNGELTVLERAVPAAVGTLAVGGRIAVLSYHSLEDRLVKQVFAAGAANTAPPGLPVVPERYQPRLKLLTRGAELPDRGGGRREPAGRPRPAARRRADPRGGAMSAPRPCARHREAGGSAVTRTAEQMKGRAGRLARLMPSGPSTAARTPFVLLVVLLLARWPDLAAAAELGAQRRIVQAEQAEAGDHRAHRRAAGPPAGRRQPTPSPTRWSAAPGSSAWCPAAAPPSSTRTAPSAECPSGPPRSLPPPRPPNRRRARPVPPSAFRLRAAVGPTVPRDPVDGARRLRPRPPRRRPDELRQVTQCRPRNRRAAEYPAPRAPATRPAARDVRARSPPRRPGVQGAAARKRRGGSPAVRSGWAARAPGCA